MLNLQERQELKVRILEDIEQARFEEHVRSNLRKTVAAITDAMDYDSLTEAVIEAAENEAWMADLLASLAFAYTDEDPRPVGALAQQLGLKHMGMTGLQTLLAKVDATFDWSLAAQRGLIIRRHVCLIEIDGQPRGTGVLVGPDLILTAQHVVNPLLDKSGNMLSNSDSRLIFYFDFFNTLMPNGQAQLNQRVDKLAAVNWLREQSPPHGDEIDQKAPPDTTPVQELDFALLCTAQAVGNEILADTQPRGWAQARAITRPLSILQRIHVSQHPGGQPLTGSSGYICALPPNGSRIRYDASTLNVSSGSPCWDNAYRLVAVHNFGGVTTAQGKLNQGVPINRILAQLASCPNPVNLTAALPGPAAGLAPTFEASYASSVAQGQNRIWEIGAQYPVLGRTSLQKQLGSMVGDNGAKLLLVRGAAGSGKSFTTKIIRQFLRPFQHTVLEVAAADLVTKTPEQVLAQLRTRFAMTVSTPLPGQDLTTRPAEIGRHLVNGFYAQLREKLQGMTARPGLPMQLWLVFDGLTEHTLADDVHEMIAELLRQLEDVPQLRIALLSYGRELPGGAVDLAESEDISPVTVADVLAHLNYAFESRKKQPLPGERMNDLATTVMNGAPAATEQRTSYIANKVRDIVRSLEA